MPNITPKTETMCLLHFHSVSVWILHHVHLDHQRRTKWIFLSCLSRFAAPLGGSAKRPGTKVIESIIAVLLRSIRWIVWPRKSRGDTTKGEEWNHQDIYPRTFTRSFLGSCFGGQDWVWGFSPTADLSYCTSFLISASLERKVKSIRIQRSGLSMALVTARICSGVLEKWALHFQ